jgi:hypothetical protein
MPRRGKRGHADNRKILELPVYLSLMPTGDSSTPIDTIESDRHFQAWRYEVGHAQLLLRSVKDDHHASRVDVLFKGVKAIDLPTKFDGFQIERDGDQYAVSGVGCSGRVIAGACCRPGPEKHSFAADSELAGQLLGGRRAPFADGTASVSGRCRRSRGRSLVAERRQGPAVLRAGSGRSR